MKQFLKKTYDFLVKDDSWLSWIVGLALAYVLIKFIIYPGIGFAFQTELPVVAIVSESMEHRMNNINDMYYMCGYRFEDKRRVSFDRWWNICGDWYVNNTDINKDVFEEFRFKNGLNKGDIIIAFGKKPEDINVGDVVIFEANRPIPIIHRVVAKNEQSQEIIFSTKGDNNADYETSLEEETVHEDRIIGVAKARIPYLGYLRVWMADLVNLFR